MVSQPLAGCVAHSFGGGGPVPPDHSNMETLPSQAYSALLNAAVKCGEVELAVDVYHQMGREGMTREKHIFQTMVDVFVKMGRHAEALGVLDDMKKAGQPAEVQLYNLIVLSCTKLNNPRAALDVYRRCVRPACSHAKSVEILEAGRHSRLWSVAVRIMCWQRAARVAG